MGIFGDFQNVSKIHPRSCLELQSSNFVHIAAKLHKTLVLDVFFVNNSFALSINLTNE